MYKFTQKHNKVILIIVCVVLLPFVGFSFSSIMSNIRGGAARADTIGTFEMPAGTQHVISADRIYALRKRVASVAPVIGFPANNVDDIWMHITQLEEAKLLGVRVDDEDLERLVTGIRTRYGLEKVQQYRDWVQEGRRVSLKEFEQTLREFLMRIELITLYETTHDISMEDVLQSFEEKNRTLTVRAVRFGIEEARKTLKPVDFPLKPKLEEYYKKNEGLLKGKEGLKNPCLYEELSVVYGYYSKFDPAKPAYQACLKEYKPAAQELQEEYERYKYTVYKNPVNKDDKAKDDKAPGEKAKDEKAKDDKAKDDKAKDDKAPGEKAMDDKAPGDKAMDNKAKDVIAKGEKTEDKKVQDKPAQEPDKPVEPFKPFIQVREDVVKRLQFKHVMKQVLAEAKAILDRAKAGKKKDDSAGKKDEKAPGEKAVQAPKIEPVPDLDLSGLAGKYGLKYQKIGPVDYEGLEKIKPFGTDARFVFGYQVMGLTQGNLSDLGTYSEKLVFFSYLAKDRPEALKPLAEIEDAVRDAAMDEAAGDRAKKLADDFYEGLEAKVMEALKPVFEKEIYEPLRKVREKEAAGLLKEMNEQRIKENKPPLKAEDKAFKESEEFKKGIQKRFEDMKLERETPRKEKELPGKVGEYFDGLAKEMNLKARDFTFLEPRRGREAAASDHDKERRALERDEVAGFIQYRAGAQALTEVGRVSKPVVDHDKAYYVLKLTKIEKPNWRSMDPRTYEKLVEQAREMRMYSRRLGMDRLGPNFLERRIHLQTTVRNRPEEEQENP